MDESFVQIHKEHVNENDDSNITSNIQSNITTTTSTITSPTSNLKDKNDIDDNDNVDNVESLLKRIKKLENENKLLKQQNNEHTNNTYGLDSHVLRYINDFDINANLKNLQDNFKSEVANRFHSIEGSVKKRMKNVHLPEYKDIQMPNIPTMPHMPQMPQSIDLKPWIEMAAKSRNIDVSLIEDSIPPKKRQLAATIVTFTLLPFCMLLTCICIYIAIFVDTTRVLGALLSVYFVHIYLDHSHEHG
mgnify:CR=1 FL=1